MRLVLPDPGLHDKCGHHYNYNRILCAAAERRGIEVRLFSQTAIEPALARELKAIPHFPNSTYFQASSDPVSGILESFIVMNEHFYERFQYLSTVVDPNTVVYFSTINQNQLLGLYRWIMELPPAGRPHLVVFPGAGSAFEEFENYIPFYRFTLRLLGRPDCKTRFCACNAAWIREFERITQLPFDFVPMLADEPGDLNAGVTPELRARIDSFKRRDSRMTVGYIGAAVARKGFHLLPPVIEGAKERQLPVKFLIQAAPPSMTPADEQMIEQLRIYDPADVCIVDEHLGAADYAALVDGPDIMLHPYSQAFYRIPLSSTFSDAMSNGKVVIVPAATALAEEAARFAGGYVVFQNQEPEDLLNSLTQAVGQYRELRVKAIHAAKAWRVHHNVEGLLDYLFQPLT